MFTLAILLGIYSYLIFSIGLLGFLNSKLVSIFSIVYFFLAIYFFKKNKIIKFNFSGELLNNKLILLLLFILILQIIVNFIGVLGPELGFDALWYHLTLPKLYILNQSIFHIPGGLLYYSDMPKLTEMLYTAGLLFGSEIIAKLISFSFGILTCVAMYKISRKFLNQFYSFLGIIIFYSNLVVGWQSITAYIDLPRTFFEVLVFWGILNWFEKKEIKWLVVSGIMMGFAISSKLVAIGSLPIFLIIFTFHAYSKNENILLAVKEFLIFVFFSFSIPLPWFIFSFINTGNPFYPYFGSIPVDSGQSFIMPNLLFIFRDFYNLFLNLSDPISPLYLMLLPIIFLSIKKADFKIKILAIYTFSSIIIWYLTQELRGGRFIMPYLPIFSILGAYAVGKLKDKKLTLTVVILIVIVGFSSIFYRGFANRKFIPLLLGRESKSAFLTKNLNFSFGDFYDTDGYFKNNVKKTDTVLLYGFHNLYYVDFPFIDSSWVEKGDSFNYIAVQNSNIPKRFLDWDLVYSNPITKVMLYRKGDIEWIY